MDLRDVVNAGVAHCFSQGFCRPFAAHQNVTVAFAVQSLHPLADFGCVHAGHKDHHLPPLLHLALCEHHGRGDLERLLLPAHVTEHDRPLEPLKIVNVRGVEVPENVLLNIVALWRE